MPKFKIGNQPFYRLGVLYPAGSIVEVESEEDASKTWKRVADSAPVTDPDGNEDEGEGDEPDEEQEPEVEKPKAKKPAKPKKAAASDEVL